MAHSYNEVDQPLLPTDNLTSEQINFLSAYINPVYLTPKALTALTERFAAESSLELHRFLIDNLAEKLKTGLAQRDVEDGLGGRRARRMPLHSSGTNVQWHVKGPPHKARYCILSDKRPSKRPNSPSYIAEDSPEWIMRRLQDVLFPSPAFRTWLANVTSLLPLRHSVEARRFRPGLDYTLATSEESETRLDVCLALTPPVEQTEKKAVEGTWESGEWGGWEVSFKNGMVASVLTKFQCYLAPPDTEEDPAVYKSSKSHKNGKPETSNGTSNGAVTNGSSHSLPAEEADDEDTMSEDEEEDSGPLLSVQPGFNRLLLVLRDERVMHFVKYLSATAPGCRWDVYGEWEVGMVHEGDSDTD